MGAPMRWNHRRRNRSGSWLGLANLSEEEEEEEDDRNGDVLGCAFVEPVVPGPNEVFDLHDEN